MSITYQEEPIYKVFHEAKKLLEDHWHEVANHQDTRPLDIDETTYQMLNRLGYIKVFTARDNDKIIGYASFTISNHLHYKTWKMAVNDVYYVDPAHRGKDGIAKDFFTTIESWLKDQGVRSVTYMDKTQKSHEKFFTGLDYKVIEQVYEKVL